MHKLEGPGFLPRHSSTAVGCWILGTFHAEKRRAKNKREAVRKQGKTSTGVVSFFLGWLLNSFKIWSFMYDTLPQPPDFHDYRCAPPCLAAYFLKPGLHHFTHLLPQTTSINCKCPILALQAPLYSDLYLGSPLSLIPLCWTSLWLKLPTEGSFM